MRIAVVSLNQLWQGKKENLWRCRNFLKVARVHECQLVIFPEMTLTGFSPEIEATAEDINQSETMAEFSKLAREFELDIVFGCCLKQQTEPLAQNVLCHARSVGVTKSVYSKLHPFSFTGENKFIKAGDRLGFVELPVGRLGGSICYDLRFPVPFSLMASDCMGVICIANWPEKRIKHWRSLLIARAIENQMFMIGVNRIGVDGNGLRYVKSSLVVAPDGEVVAPFLSGDEFDIYDIDELETANYRKEFPALGDQNFDLYWRLRE